MEQEPINLVSDNECEESVIILDDSEKEVIVLDDSIAEPCPRQVSNFPTDIEEGEVTAEEEEEDPKLVFSIQFESVEYFEKFQEKVQTNLRAAFASDDIDIQINENNDSSNPRICAYERVTDCNESEDLSIFQIDTTPCKKLNTEHVPSYKRSVKMELKEQSITDAAKNDEDKCERPKVVAACFNCGSTGHTLRECPKKRNNANIQRAKKHHSSNKFERYHVDVEQRFSHIKPGELSKEARNALGLQRNELPFIFYRMRVLGYPPAWLEDAQVTESGIALFNADGTEVRKSDKEDGNDNLNENFKYNTSKIIGFPGFNVQPDSKFYDDHRHHGVPALSKSQAKERFIEALGDKVINGYKRRKLNLPTAHNIEKQPENIDLSTVDMEIDDDDNDASSNAKVEFTRPPLPSDDPIQQFIPLPPPDNQYIDDSTNRRPVSPSLDDLQAKQEEILKQLQGNISIDEHNQQDSPLSGRINNDSYLKEEKTEQNNSTSLPEHHFKSSHLGTPLLKFSEFDTLPSDEKFKVGVSDVINFENLPDSTGKYEQMKGVIHTVREKISQLQSEDD